jgi:hypothetical protein
VETLKGMLLFSRLDGLKDKLPLLPVLILEPMELLSERYPN